MLFCQWKYFKEIPNTLAISGLALVILAVVVQGFKKVPFKWTKLMKMKKSLEEA